MFPAKHANHNLQRSKQEHSEGQDPTPIREIVRQETDDGRLIVRFFVSTMQGQLQDAKPSHRIAAARQLVKLGFTEAQDFIDENAPAPKRRRRAQHSPPADPKLASGLAKIVRQETDDGRVAVRFLVDVMQGGLPGFKPHHRLAAARELLRRGFDDTPADDNAGPSDDDAAAPSDPPDDYDYGKCGIYHYDGRGNMITCESVDCPLWRKGYSVRPAQGGPGHSHISAADASRSGPDHSRDRAADASQSGPDHSRDRAADASRSGPDHSRDRAADISPDGPDHSRDRAADASPDGPDHPRDRAAMPERPPARNGPTPGSDTPPESDRGNRLPIFF